MIRKINVERNEVLKEIPDVSTYRSASDHGRRKLSVFFVLYCFIDTETGSQTAHLKLGTRYWSESFQNKIGKVYQLVSEKALEGQRARIQLKKQIFYRSRHLIDTASWYLVIVKVS